MSADREHVIATIARGSGELRISRKSYQGGPPYTDLRLFYYDEQAGEMRPGKGCTIRDSELHQALDALNKVARKLEGQPPTPPEPRVIRSSRPAQRTLPLSGLPGAPVAAMSDAEIAADSRLF